MENIHSELAETSRNLKIDPVIDTESPFEVYRIWPKSGFIWSQNVQKIMDLSNQIGERALKICF